VLHMMVMTMRILKPAIQGYSLPPLPFYYRYGIKKGGWFFFIECEYDIIVCSSFVIRIGVIDDGFNLFLFLIRIDSQ
jgi:hypothetical protein